ncbi:MAG TPA: DUF4062 domain-containing protein [Pyrinomonadaceae bacterium]|nr:DUF4062 domain-containing protein [Pyrinomonadaceae bacterium]
MAKVYVSSTLVDLKPEREAVIDWLVAANHQPVHSYRPNSETVRESCLEDIDGCDLYVVILGHRYGFQPEEGNAERLSITHLEFRRAKEIPRIALLRTSVPDFALSDLGDPTKAAMILAFIAEVRAEVRSAEFKDLQGLLQGLSTGVLGELDRAARKPGAKSMGGMSDDPRVLRILDTLTEELERKNKLIDQGTAENVTLRGQVRELQDQLRAAVSRTVTAASQPDASAAEIAAVDALEAGDTRPAEALLKKQEREEVAQIGNAGADDQQQRAEAAALAREQGALAMGHDVRAALEAFQRVVGYEPDDTWTHFFIGDLHLRLGDLKAAMQSFRRGNEISEARVDRDPANTEWQRDLSVSYERIGDVLVVQGDGPGALAQYRKEFAIREALARDVANTQSQRDLSVCHNKIGDVLVDQGDGLGALAAYRKALVISEALALRDATITEWQRDLSVSHLRIGDVLNAQGDEPGALSAYREGLTIAEALAASDPANTEWQHDLSVGHNKIGGVLVAQDDRTGALAAYRKGLAIREALAARDPANTQWQRDLSVSHDNIGDVLMTEGDGSEALAAYRKGRVIFEALVARDPANTQWQRDLSVCHEKVGDRLVAQGDGPGALAAYRKGLAIREALAEHDRANTLWQTDVAVSYSKLGRLVHGQDEDVRRDYLLRGREILARLKEEGRLLPNQDWIEWFDTELAKLPESKKPRPSKSPKPPRK